MGGNLAHCGVPGMLVNMGMIKGIVRRTVGEADCDITCCCNCIMSRHMPSVVDIVGETVGRVVVAHA